MFRRQVFTPAIPTRHTTWDLMRDMDDIFESLKQATFGGENRRDLSSFDNDVAFRPAVDVKENEKSYLLALDLPGLSEKDVKVELKDGALTISGERKHESHEDGEGWSRTERSFGRFHRSFGLPSDVDSQKINAQFENGVLYLSLPKTEVAQPVSIPIRNGRTETASASKAEAKDGTTKETGANEKK